MARPAALSNRSFARLAGVSHQSVAQARREGRLVAGADGRLDPEQPVNAAYLALHRPAETGGGSETAQLDALLARGSLMRHVIERMEADYVERAAIAEQWRAEARRICDQLATIPERWTATVAEELGRPEEQVRTALERFTRSLMEETSSFEAEAVAAVMQLS